MTYAPIKDKYIQLLETQRKILWESEKRVVADEPDSLLLDNVNYFVKSYLVNICTYLEAYLQDLAFSYCSNIAERVKTAQIPKNFVGWHVAGDIKGRDLSYGYLDVTTNKKKISDELSGNPSRTIVLYRYLGLDLLANDEFCANKDVVYSYVDKRNNIIHHNDDAGDLSFSDLRQFIDVVLRYMDAVYVVASPYDTEV